VKNPKGVEKYHRVQVERNLGEVFFSRVQKVFYYRGYLHLTMGILKLIEMEMTRDRHMKGFRGKKPQKYE
jgi:hypothetical protein